MNDRLDHLVERLAAAPTDHRLEHLEAQVGRGVAAQVAQTRAARALGPVRVASIGLTLAVGVTAGGLTAASSAALPRSADAFSVAANLAPSTLLEGTP